MSTESPYPGGMNGYVPWTVYLSDLTRQDKRFDRIEGKQDEILEQLQEIHVELARDDGAEGERAQHGAEARHNRFTRNEKLWGLAVLVVGILLSAGVSVLVNIFTAT